MFFLRIVRDGISTRIPISCAMDANLALMRWTHIAEHATSIEDLLRRLGRVRRLQAINHRAQKPVARVGEELISAVPRNTEVIKNASPLADGAPTRVRKDVAVGQRRLIANGVATPSCRYVEIPMQLGASHRQHDADGVASS